VKTTLPRLMALATGMLLLTAVVSAQNQTSLPVSQTSLRSITAQSPISALANLPEADSLVFINTQRIINEATPRVISQTDLAKLRQAFSDIKQASGFDPAHVEFVVIAMRFRRPAADLSFLPPEFIAVTSGDFSSESLVGLAKKGLEGSLREEKYGTQTIQIFDIDPIKKQAETNPLLKSFSEMGLVAISGNTLAVGSIEYLKAALDAADGRGRINQETLNSLLRDPNALISIAGSPLSSFSKSLGLMGTEATPRERRCDSKLGDFYLAVTMETTDFKVRGAMNADNPDTAKIINNLIAGLLQTAGSATDDKSAQSVLKQFNLKADGNEVVLQADIPQQIVADFIKEQMAPKPAPTKATTTKGTKRKPKTKPRRKTRRTT